jgi:hypothetical protein
MGCFTLLLRTLVGVTAVTHLLGPQGAAAQGVPDRAAQVTETSMPLAGRPHVAPSRTSEAPDIDGRLDETSWLAAARLGGLVQQMPLDGAPASEATEILLSYDDDHLYIGIRARYADPSLMRANRVDRDRAGADDLIRIFFDTFLDQQRGYAFEVNAYGVQGDGTISRSSGGGPIPSPDRSWNTLFDSGAQIVEDGFTAEIAIPFKSLRYPGKGNGEAHRWGLQIIREVKGKNGEVQVWAPISRDDASFFAQMGVLEGMTDISTSRNIEILPTFTAIQYGDIDPTRPGFVNRDLEPDAGGSVKYGVTPNLTLDATINPDFSQIESDEAQIEVNQRFPLFFPELRPFFIEGAEIFRIPVPVTLVHTRTIVDPDWGLKLTGKVGRVAMGFVAANDRAPGNLDDGNDPLFGRKAHTVIARAVYDLYPQSSVGTIITNREFADSYSRLFDLDGDLQLTPTLVYRFRAIHTFHKESGQPERRGNHYTSRLVRSGRHVNLDLFYYHISPDLDTDVGFVRRTDIRQGTTTLGYRFWPQDSWIINWGPSVNYLRNYNYDNVLEDERVAITLDFDLARNVALSGTVSTEMERFGNIDFEKQLLSLRGNVNTSRSYQIGANVTIGDAVRYSASPFLARTFVWGMNATLRPISRLQSNLDITASRLSDPRNGGSEIVDVKLFRLRTDVQLSERLGLRNIAAFNTRDETLDLNVLLNYRVNAGTVFYVGYDDHYQQADLIEGDRDGDGIDDQLFQSDALRRTNRAIFIKLQYLLRY